jgi:hypothetical protein
MCSVSTCRFTTFGMAPALATHDVPEASNVSLSFCYRPTPLAPSRPCIHPATGWIDLQNFSIPFISLLQPSKPLLASTESPPSQPLPSNPSPSQPLRRFPQPLVASTAASPSQCNGDSLHSLSFTGRSQNTAEGSDVFCVEMSNGRRRVYRASAG